MKHYLLVCVATFGLGIFFAQRANGALVVSIQDANVAGGGTGFADVYLRSTDGTDMISEVSYQFVLTGTGLGGTLGFVDQGQQLDAAIVQSIAAPIPYVFLGNTNTSFYGYGLPNLSRTMIAGGDTTADFANFTITTAPRLLARVVFQDITPTPNASTGTYSLGLNLGLTGFKDETDTSVPFTIDRLGSITVGATAVPEPSSMALAASVLCGLGLRRWRKLKR